VRPSAAGAKLISLDDTAVQSARVVRLGDFVAVVAEREEAAVRAARSLQASWDTSSDLPAMESLHESLRHEEAAERVAAASGYAEAAIQRAAIQLSATYTMPFQAHASVGPSCAVAAFDGESLTVWCATQGVHPLRAALAGLLRLPEECVRVIYIEGSGSYGHNGSDDVAADAAVLARELGQPVRVQWSRSPGGLASGMPMGRGAGEPGGLAVADRVRQPGRVRRGVSVAGRACRRAEPPA